MYLDNIMAEKFASENATKLSYTDVLQDVILCTEVASETELNIIKAEFVAKKLGNEGADEWWPKIKAFFRKLWETVKRVVIKFVAWCKTIPDKLVVLWRKILKWWNERGVEGRIKNLQKNISKGLVGPQKELVREFQETDWGYQDPECVTIAFTSILSALNGNMTTPAINGQGQIANSVRHHVNAAINNFTGNAQAAGVISGIFSGAQQLKDSFNFFMDLDYEESTPSEFTAAASAIMSATADIIEEIENSEKRNYDPTDYTELSNWFASVKNNTIMKQYDRWSKRIDHINNSLESLHKMINALFERAYKEDDRDVVQGHVRTLKLINCMTAAFTIINSKLGKMYATCAVNRAKMVNAAIKCYTSEGATERMSNYQYALGTPQNPVVNYNTSTVTKAQWQKAIPVSNAPDWVKQYLAAHPLPNYHGRASEPYGTVTVNGVTYALQHA